MTSIPKPSTLFEKWNLNPSIVHLNHGSFGGTPKFIIDKQKEYIDKLESEPVDFSVRQWYPLYYENKKALADFVGTSEHHIYLVPNTTIGINHILHNQKESNKQWLTTNHAYGACIHAFHKIGEERGNEIIKVQIPFPLHSENEILEQLENNLSPRTSLALIDYITSATAIIFPIKKIIDLLHNRGVKVIVDAAHAPGMVDFNIDALDADYFVANCHKWICSPKGSAFVYVNPKHQKEYKPIFYSFYNDWNTEEAAHWSNQFIWEGTKDYSAYLCIKDALSYMPSLINGGWNEIRTHNRNLAIQGAKLIANKLGVELPVPESMLGSIVNIPLWDDKIPLKFFNYYTEVKNILYDKYKIEVPCILFPQAPKQYVRVSAQLYNSIEEYEYLGNCLLEIKKNSP
jgi:isopenicillin-N epimerase